tara:strand:+ start:1837 stop:2205 length:369 start_codon:yes stop_codon:yes gene_type:complete
VLSILTNLPYLTYRSGVSKLGYHHTTQQEDMRMGVNEERYCLACSDPECETNHPELNDPPPKFAVEVIVGCLRNANHTPIDEQIDSFQPQAFTCTWCGSKATEVAVKPLKINHALNDMRKAG